MWRSVSILGIVFLWTSCSDNNASGNDPLIVAHRGVSYAYPENTVQAFSAAVDQGIENVECDIYLTKDDSVMIFHDLDVSRLTTLTGLVQEYTADELRQGISGRSGGTGITLNEFITRYGNSFSTLFIEIKEGQPDSLLYRTVRSFVSLIRSSGIEHKVIATCTAHGPLDTVKRYSTGIRAAYEVREESDLVQQLKRYPSVLISYEKLSPAIYQTVRSAGGTLIAFTPNTVPEYDRTISNGCDFIMTDNPLELKKYLLSRNSVAAPE
jgi:glycerophosphoryl diester phosphodiesterase